jgi:hypothetical protein
MRVGVAAVSGGLALGCGRVTSVSDGGTPMTQPADGGSHDRYDADGDPEVGDSSAGKDVMTSDLAQPAPPATWTEHWYEHNQSLDLIAYNDDAVIYFDKDVVREGSAWMLPFITSAWRYTQRTYGDFKLTPAADGRFYAIFHQSRYVGCHGGYYFNAVHDGRNGSDCGPGPWALANLTEPHFNLLYEMGNITEFGSNHFFTSPTRQAWDAHFKEFFIYDALLAVGLTDEALAAHEKFTASVDAKPRMPTYWFRDWFYPLWRDHGHAQVMVKFFKLLSQHAPASMTVPEMVHFMSGAAGTNLEAQAVNAFGAETVTDAALAKARLDFPNVSYPLAVPGPVTAM